MHRCSAPHVRYLSLPAVLAPLVIPLALEYCHLGHQDGLRECEVGGRRERGEGRRVGGMEGGREGGREGGMEGGRKGGRKREMEEGKEGRREGGREGGGRKCWREEVLEGGREGEGMKGGCKA